MMQLYDSSHFMKDATEKNKEMKSWFVTMSLMLCFSSASALQFNQVSNLYTS